MDHMDKMHNETERIREFLHNKVCKRRNAREELRLEVLAQVKEKIRDTFFDSGMEVFLIGSLLRSYHFSEYSDIDIVIKNYKGEIYEIQKELENALNKDVDIIIYEKSPFKELIDRFGEKVL